MGLMYIFPVSANEGDRVVKSDNKILLKTYGLPMIFWGYLAAALVVIGSMWLASRAVINKLLTYEDLSLKILAASVQFTLIATPIILLGLFFYEKQFEKSKNTLNVIFKVFFLTIFKRKIELDSPDAFSINHYMDSPNMAKIANQPDLKQFENRGYFELHAISNNKKILIDRHSRKADLVKLKELLATY